MIKNNYQKQLIAVREREHSHCFVCDPNNALGFRLDFQACDDGSVTASFNCKELFQGYSRWLHGGVISSLIDGAMTSCLFAHGKAAATGELAIRFHHPVVINRRAFVKAWLEKSRPPLHFLQAELSQEGNLLVAAKGKFMERSTEKEVGDNR